MSIIKFVRNMSPNIRQIFKTETSLGKKEVFSTYLGLKFRQLFLCKILGRKLYQERIFGFTVNFFDHSMFLYLFEEVFIKQEYYFKANVPRPTIIDCGSNIGLSVLYFKTLYPGSEIIAFEPDKKTFELLKINIETNRLSDVKIYNRALHNAKGTIHFYSDPAEPGSPRMSAHQERMSGAGEAIESDVLSAYVNAPVDFLKMDIEGSETLVMNEMASLGKLRYIKEMVMEYHHHIRPEEDTLSEMLKMFEENGFGYQITTSTGFPVERKVMQDLLIYAYQK